jgi:hypothetical protein
MLNDSLLQSYRSFHLTLQSFFIAIGAGLVVAMFGFDNPSLTIVAFPILIVVIIIAILMLFLMHRIIISRGKDVSWWHSQIIDAENDLNSEKRCFSSFKFQQKKHRKKRKKTPEVEELEKKFRKEKLSQDDIDILIGTGLGHTRKVLDLGLFVGIFIIWVLIIVMGLIKISTI